MPANPHSSSLTCSSISLSLNHTQRSRQTVYNSAFSVHPPPLCLAAVGVWGQCCQAAPLPWPPSPPSAVSWTASNSLSVQQDLRVWTPLSL